MITTATADELLELLRSIMRANRTARLGPESEDMPGWKFAVLGLLAREGEQRLGQVAAHLEVDPSVASRQVAMLEQLGFVTRRPDPADGRAQLLAISPAGLAARDGYLAMRARWVAEALQGWDDAEVTHLVARLRQLVDDLHCALAAHHRPPARVARSAS
ncbi:DNA-binding MarR family transcriptional regulator [Pseudonocardia hierapolitana]|uniref:DNA-binding MarR family transcriptional regulator n=1 Tax=Pseudonocardia hierapolitana TaxID=1128676 RepID=A0A561SYQ1_9PSEU|nr:MarR family winged helix-turn-helix transcriptional regulator [Pseudonocardia hierapolitana]TWF79999.1 DNA-binding MarR family transcriptional regulator [Pseudonocardia hierapolitana]